MHELWQKSSQKLLEMAEQDPQNIPLLERIICVLSSRKNETAWAAYLKLGTLLDEATEHQYNRRRSENYATQTVREIEESMESAADTHRDNDEYFLWPSTNAPASRRGYKGDFFDYEDGLLSFVGYQVGVNGETSDIRLRILDCVFHNKLPHVESEEYMSQWGEPESADRLRKMAHTLAALARNAKRNSRNYSRAIDEWESDLDYLHLRYYVGKFKFQWPGDL